MFCYFSVFLNENINLSDVNRLFFFKLDCGLYTHASLSGKTRHTQEKTHHKTYLPI